jgi:hypothetical protein
MAENESIGGIAVDVVGDYSQLQPDLEAAVQIAQRAGEGIGEALNAGVQSADNLSSALTNAAAASGDFGAQIEGLVSSGASLNEALAQVGTSAEGIAGGLGDAGAAAEGAAGQLSMFDEAAVLPAEAAAGLEGFAGALDPVGSAAESAATGMVGLAESGTQAGAALEGSATAAEGFASATTDAAGAQDAFVAQIEALVASGMTLSEALAAAGVAAEGMGAATEQAGSEAGAALTEAASGAGTLAAGLSETGAAAGEAATQLGLFDEAVTVPYADAAGQLNLFATELEPIPGAADSAASALAGMGQSADAAGAGLHEVEPAVQQTTSSLEGMVGALVAVGAALEFTQEFIEFGHAALEAADAVDDATKAMGMLGGSADQAEGSVGKLRDIAKDDALSMPEILKASTRMTAFLGSSQPVPGIMRALGDSAAVMGTSLSGASAGFEKIVSSGELSTKGLLKLGLTLEDVAKAMHTTADKAKDAFKALDQSQQIAVMEQALRKFDGAAKSLADDSLGAMARAGLAWEEVLEAIGTALDPVVKKMADFVTTDIVPFIQNLVHAFQELPEPVRNTVIGIGLLAAAIVPIAGGLAALMAAVAAIGPALAPVGAAFVSLGTSITGVGAGYTSMLAAGVLRTAGWIAVAVAVLELANAYLKMKEAEKGLEQATKLQQDNLASLEISLKRQGANIEEVSKAYHNGEISYTTYLQKLRDVGMELGKAAKAHADHAAAATASTSALSGAAIKMQTLRDAVASTKTTLDQATATFNQTKQNAAAVADAYDKWKAATAALKTAQTEHLPVMKSFAQATRDFVTDSLRVPSAQEAAANATEGARLKFVAETDALTSAQSALALVIAKYHDHNATAAQVAAALDRVNAAQKALTAGWTALDAPVANFKALELGINNTNSALSKMLTPLLQIPPPVRDATFLLSEMGVKIDKAAGNLQGKLLPLYDELGTKKHTLDEENAAWQAVESSITSISDKSFPKVIAAWEQHIRQMVELKATQGDILSEQAKMLDAEIQYAEKSGASATDQIIALQNVKLKQDALYDSTHAMGQLYVDVTNDIVGGYDKIGAAIADTIFDGGKLGKAFQDLGKQVLKSITEDWINAGLKQLKTALSGVGLDVENLSKQFLKLGKTISDSLGAGSGAAKGLSASSPSAGGAGAAMTGGGFGAVGAIASVGTLISSIIGNFQTAKLETTANAIEHNTSFSEIVQEQFKADQWEQHGQLLTKLDLLINETRSMSYSLATAVNDSLIQVAGVLERAQLGANNGALIAGFNTVVHDSTNAIVNELHGGFTAMASAFSSSFIGMANVMVSGFQGVIQTLAGVKKYAGGGSVAETGLAMLHAGEVVVPAADVPNMVPHLPDVPTGSAAPSSPGASTYAAAAGGAGSNVGTVTFNIYESSNPRETVRQVAKGLKQISPKFAVYAT